MIKSRNGCRRRKTSWLAVVALSMWTFLVAAPLGWSPVAHAQGTAESPLAAMRAAAQEAGDPGPDPASFTKRPPVPQSLRTALLRASIQAAVHDEVGRISREGTLAPDHVDKAPAVVSSAGGGGAERQGPSDLGQLHTETLSAQQAQHNRAVLNQNANGPGPHNNSPGHASMVLTGAGGKR